MSDEMYAKIRDMKNEKSTGIDEIPAEFLKMLEGDALKRLVELCIEIYIAQVSGQRISLRQ